MTCLGKPDTPLVRRGTSTGNSEFPAATVAKASVEKGGGLLSLATEGFHRYWAAAASCKGFQVGVSENFEGACKTPWYCFARPK